MNLKYEINLKQYARQILNEIIKWSNAL